MKNSGIEWIGEIPENWEVIKLKYVVSIKSGEFISKEDYTDDGYDIIGSNGFIGKTYKVNTTETVLTTGRVGSTGTCYIVSNAWITDNVLILYVQKYCNIKYLYYIIPNFNYEMMSTGTAQLLITGTTLKNQIIPFPDLNEQQKIADYLDKRCENIDGLVELQNRIIEKLKEYKQSVITEAVTKGLDPAAKMKNSGVEWIGEIPENWEVKRLKNCGDFCSNGVDKKIYPDLPTYKAIHYINVYKNKLGILNDDSNYLIISCTNEKADLTRLQNGDIIITNSSETPDDIGVAAYVNDIDKDTLLGYHLMRFRPLHDINSKFMLYCLNSKYVNAYFASVSNGITRYSLLGDDIKSLCFCCPPIDEQQKIADYLDSKCAEIDKLIEIKQKKIEKLQDYKKSLIYECVTGKREVS